MLSKQAFYHIDGEEFVLPINPSNLIGITYCLRELEDKLNKLNIVFGWVDFRGDGKYRRENLSFPLFGNERKMGGVEN